MASTAIDFDCLVVGAGVIGLASARALSQEGLSVLVVDAAAGIGTETSSRNSEVIHAGLYYPPGSLMARTCIAGRERLYAYCASRGVEARAIGKLIVATSQEEEAELARIAQNAERSGNGTLRELTQAEANGMEPELRCTAALLSPRTGIVDSHAYMLALQGEAEAHGAQFVFHAPVVAAERFDNGDHSVVIGGIHETQVRCRHVVNAAGLHAVRVAAMLGVEPARLPTAHYARGHYFALRHASPFRHLVYPVPVPGGLGIHLTLDLGGRARFGPDVQWIEDTAYSFNASERIAGFYEAIRRYYPGLPDDSLVPDYCGIRPKISGPGEPKADFRIDGPAEHGVTGLVNLLGIESPGLTASLELADLAVEKLVGGVRSSDVNKA